MPTQRRLLIALSAAFILFLLLMIAIANRGDGNRWWAFIHTIPYGDKLGHIGLMATLGLLCNLAFAKSPHLFRPTLATLILATAISLEEISQIFISARNYDTLDLIANLIGLATGQFIAAISLKTTVR